MSDASGLTELDERPQGRREWHGYLRSLILPLALVVAIIAGLLYLQANRNDGADSAYGTVDLPATKNATNKAPGPQAGRAAPDFLLLALDGSETRLSDLQGRPVVVNFWASWCTSCREETPDLVRAYDAHKAQGLQMLGVNLRESDSRARSFAGDWGIAYPVLLDQGGEVAQTWRIGGPSSGLPSSYFIDAKGVVQKVVYGTLTDKDLAAGLDLILKAAN